MNKHCFLAKSLGVLSLCTENISFKKSFKLSSFSFKKKAEEGLEAEGMASTSAKGSKDKAALQLPQLPAGQVQPPGCRQHSLARKCGGGGVSCRRPIPRRPLSSTGGTDCQ